MDKSPPLQVVLSTVGSYIPPPFLSPPLPTFHPSLFPNYKASQVLGHPAPTLGIPLSTPRVLSSLVQPMEVYHHSPSPSFLSYPSTVVAPVGHPPPPPFLCHPSIMDTPVCHQPPSHFPSHPSIVDAPIHHPPPSHFPSDASTKDATIDVVSEKVVQLSTPPARDSPVWPKLFTGGITDRSRSRRIVSP
uniref:Uncharacterized protein n=1 Tax=Picea sitchensis TaxID=3332 RepID=A9NSY2_PICSI|nr:unknown [Picea sitchensis]